MGYRAGKPRRHAGQRKRTGDRDMAEHKQGSMDIRVQEKTFAGFIRMVSWGIVIVLAVLVFLALANA
jgi:hypothetical protein